MLRRTSLLIMAAPPLSSHHDGRRLVGDHVGLNVFDVTQLADRALREPLGGDADVAVLERRGLVAPLRRVDHAAVAIPAQHQALLVVAGAIDPALLDIGFGHGHIAGFSWREGGGGIMSRRPRRTEWSLLSAATAATVRRGGMLNTTPMASP